MKTLFKVLLGLQLGKIPNFNPQVCNIIFFLTLLLWKISKHTTVGRTFKESPYTNHPYTIIKSKLICFIYNPTNPPTPTSLPIMSSHFIIKETKTQA